MENNNAALIYNGTDYSPYVKNTMFKLGIIIGSLTVGAILSGKVKGCTNFYEIMQGRLNI
jgi:hypothetical protein